MSGRTTCRRCLPHLLGDQAVVGLSTHAPDELDAAMGAPVTYLSAGPVEATPTKPGRPGTGVGYASLASARSAVPVFVTGGVTPRTIPALAALGLRHFVVVRALTEAADPRAAAAALRSAIDPSVTRSRVRGCGRATDQRRHHPRVGTEPVSGTLDDPELGAPLRSPDELASGLHGHDPILRTVDDQDPPRRHHRDGSERLEVIDALGERLGVFQGDLRIDGARDKDRSMELLRATGPRGDVRRRRERRDAPDPLVVGRMVEHERAAEPEAREP